MAFSTKLKIIDAKMEQQSGSTLTLSGNTTVADSGNLKYASHPTFVADEEIVDKKYVDDNVVSGSTYDLDSPSTVTVGGSPAGTVLTGKTSNEILEEILVPYLAPTMSSFIMDGQATTVEVGTTVSGSKTFSWGFTNSGNVTDNTMDIIDVGTSILATDISTVSPSGSIGINSVVFSAEAQTHQWRGEADSTVASTFGKSTTITSYYPVFYGTVTAAGAAGANRPVANQTLINSGTKSVTNTQQDLNLTFNSGADDYTWFAIPNSSPAKTVWYVSVFDNGTIGGAATTGSDDLGPNRYPDAAVVSVNDPASTWSGVSYKFYISNWQGAATSIDMQ